MRWTVLALLVSACSLVFVRPSEPPDCARSYAVPAVDTIAAGLWAAETGAALHAVEAGDENADGDRVVWGAAIATLLAGSAVYGYAVVHDCRSASSRELTCTQDSECPRDQICVSAGDHRVCRKR